MNIVRFGTYKFLPLRKHDRCRSFQWIDGPEAFYPENLLFPYDRSESCLLRSFKRSVPPPLNPPPMTNEEKAEATTRRVCSPPPCKCGYHSDMMNPPPGLDYTPFSVV
jgi:hypothetical protein